MKKISFDDLNGKVCVITGGAGVIGISLVKALVFCRHESSHSRYQ